MKGGDFVHVLINHSLWIESKTPKKSWGVRHGSCRLSHLTLIDKPPLWGLLSLIKDNRLCDSLQVDIQLVWNCVIGFKK